MMVHANLWVGCSFKCLVGSDLLFLSSCVHSIVFWHYELSLQYNFGHKNKLQGKWHNYNGQPYPLMETMTALFLCSNHFSLIKK